MRIDTWSMMDTFEDTWRVLRAWDILFEDIKPQAKQSVRFTRTGHAHPDRKKEKYVKDLVSMLRRGYNGPCIQGKVRLTVIYSFPWRKEDKPYRSLGWIPMVEKPDVVDNLNKPLADAMQGICFTNDSIVVEIRARKIRSDLLGIMARVEEVVPIR